MKRFIFAAIATALLSAPCYAAAPESTEDNCDFGKNEFRISYGRVSIPGFAMAFGSIFGSLFSAPATGEAITYTSTGAMSMGYFRHLTPHVAVGGDFSCEATTINTGGDTPTVTHSTFATVMPGAKFAWFNREHFGMYSKVLVGACMDVTDDGVSAIVAGQISAIAMEFGGKHLRGFSEFGVGYEGLLTLGLSYRF